MSSPCPLLVAIVLKIAVLVLFTVLPWARKPVPKLLALGEAKRAPPPASCSRWPCWRWRLGIAVGSAKLGFGASMALGAFLAGMVVGQSDFSSRAASDALPLRDAFAVLFFVSMGMLFDPRQLLPKTCRSHSWTLAIVLVGKPRAAH